MLVFRFEDADSGFNRFVLLFSSSCSFQDFFKADAVFNTRILPVVGDLDIIAFLVQPGWLRVDSCRFPDAPLVAEFGGPGFQGIAGSRRLLLSFPVLGDHVHPLHFHGAVVHNLIAPHPAGV
ncbi:MAG: hypothetical protein IPN20_26150 [Haliscomenobacter sp.]|nr:hypothetical protein [Haliscomenobacter sp.]